MFWTYRYFHEVADDIPTNVQDESWNKYTESVIEWNENNVYAEHMTETYFSFAEKCKLAAFGNALRKLHICLTKIRYPNSNDTGTFCSDAHGDVARVASNIKVFKGLLDEANKALDLFIEGLNPVRRSFSLSKLFSSASATNDQNPTISASCSQ